MLVVAGQLCEGFFQDDVPHGLIFCDVPEDGFKSKRAIGQFYLLKRQEIVHNNGMRNSKCIQVQSVDSVLVDLAIGVKEYFLEALRFFCKSTCSGHVPAVTNGSLPNVFRCDSIAAPEKIFLKFVGCA